jgi:hypothetical protein
MSSAKQPRVRRRSRVSMLDVATAQTFGLLGDVGGSEGIAQPFHTRVKVALPEAFLRGVEWARKNLDPLKADRG